MKSKIECKRELLESGKPFKLNRESFTLYENQLPTEYKMYPDSFSFKLEDGVIKAIPNMSWIHNRGSYFRQFPASVFEAPVLQVNQINLEDIDSTIGGAVQYPVELQPILEVIAKHCFTDDSDYSPSWNDLYDFAKAIYDMYNK